MNDAEQSEAIYKMTLGWMEEASFILPLVLGDPSLV